MFVIFSPAGGDGQRWEFDPSRVRQSAAEVAEKRYGRNWDQLVADLQAGNAKARRVVLWHLMCRDHPTLRYEDTPDFAMGELQIEHTRDELIAARDQLAKSGLSGDDMNQAMVMLDAQIGEADGDDMGGKADSNSAG